MIYKHLVVKESAVIVPSVVQAGRNKVSATLKIIRPILSVAHVVYRLGNTTASQINTVYPIVTDTS